MLHQVKRLYEKFYQVNRRILGWSLIKKKAGACFGEKRRLFHFFLGLAGLESIHRYVQGPEWFLGKIKTMGLGEE